MPTVKAIETRDDLRTGPDNSPRSEGTVVLAVGTPTEWRDTGMPPEVAGNLAFVGIHEVDRSLLEEYQPAAIVSPVLAKGFDCIDLAQLLQSLDYKGMYRATAINLPKPQLVENEISQLCPRLDFQIVTDF